jgi:hypothetical protein
MSVHRHERPQLPPADAAAYGGPTGTPIDLDPTADLIGAALAGCRPCQRQRMYEVTRGDHLAVTHLLAMSYNTVSQILAPMIGPMSDAHITSRYQPATGTVFRALRDQGPAAAAAAVHALDRDGRRVAIDDALDLIAGVPGALEAFATMPALVEAVPHLATANPGPGAGLGRQPDVRVVSYDELQVAIGDLPDGPTDLLVGWYGPYPALVADKPPTRVGVTGVLEPATPAFDLDRRAWLSAGFTTASPDTQPPALPPGWRVQIRYGGLATVRVPGTVRVTGGDYWWQADEVGAAIELPEVWLAAAREHGAVALLIGDIGLDLDDNYAAAMTRATAAGRIVVGLAALDETR